MKSTITESQPPVITYPCLMQSLVGLIVLFTSETEGTVIHVGDDEYNSLGDHKGCWRIATDDTYWAPFTGTITLSNS